LKLVKNILDLNMRGFLALTVTLCLISALQGASVKKRQVELNIDTEELTNGFNEFKEDMHDAADMIKETLQQVPDHVDNFVEETQQRIQEGYNQYRSDVEDLVRQNYICSWFGLGCADESSAEETITGE